MNYKKMISKVSCLGFALGLVAAGCASVEKAKLAHESPEDAIEEVASIERRLIGAQVDLKAPEPFFEGSEHLEEAREDFVEGDDADEILEEASYAKAYFLKAEKLSKDLSPQTNLLETREQVVSQRTVNSSDLMETFRDIDEDWRDTTDEFTDELSASDYSRLQRRYLDLETAFVQKRELSSVRVQLKQAEEMDMDDLAPTTYNRLSRELKAAENLISANVRNPENYRTSVNRAKSASNLMADVMKEFDSRGEDTSEEVVLALVAKNRKISTLNKSMNDLELEMINAEVDAMTMSGELNYKNRKLSDYQSRLDYQQAMNQVRKEFDDKDVAVFRQGDSLVIRMKNIKFDVGSSKIPSRAFGSLEKVKSIVEKFEAPQVVIQGHTDSTGPNKLNKSLSEQRAQAVAKFMSKDALDDTEVTPVGYGESRPIVSNNTEKGRSKNRRVDIVIKTKTSS